HALARYAALAQEAGLVPIVEPEVLMDGTHSIEEAYRATARVQHAVFTELRDQRVELEGMLLKPNMVLSGYDSPTRASVAEVAEQTLRCLRHHVPAAVPGIVFLSGGQSDEAATEHLNAMNALGPQPWELSFSYGRALQAPAQKAWAGSAANVAAAQRAFLKRARLHGLLLARARARSGLTAGATPRGLTPGCCAPTARRSSGGRGHRPGPAGAALADRHERPLARPRVDLARASDLLLRVLDPLEPLGEPARRARDREHDREHRDRQAERLVDQSRVEVDVRVELAAHEVLVLERDLLELERDVEQRVAAGDLEDVVGDLLDDLRARVVVLVDAVAEAHQATVARLHRLDELGHARDVADLAEHPQHRLVGAPVERAVERGGGA